MLQLGDLRKVSQATVHQLGVFKQVSQVTDASASALHFRQGVTGYTTHASAWGLETGLTGYRCSAWRHKTGLTGERFFSLGT
jgi:hypothetical protein